MSKLECTSCKSDFSENKDALASEGYKDAQASHGYKDARASHGYKDARASESYGGISTTTSARTTVLATNRPRR